MLPLTCSERDGAGWSSVPRELPHLSFLRLVRQVLDRRLAVDAREQQAGQAGLRSRDLQALPGCMPFR